MSGIKKQSGIRRAMGINEVRIKFHCEMIRRLCGGDLRPVEIALHTMIESPQAHLLEQST